MSYAADLTPDEAFDLLRTRPDAVLVDVRTRAEWSYVGIPDLTALGRDAVLLEWQTYPDGARWRRRRRRPRRVTRRRTT